MRRNHPDSEKEPSSPKTIIRSRPTLRLWITSKKFSAMKSDSKIRWTLSTVSQLLASGTWSVQSTTATIFSIEIIHSKPPTKSSIGSPNYPYKCPQDSLKPPEPGLFWSFKLTKSKKKLKKSMNRSPNLFQPHWLSIRPKIWRKSFHLQLLPRIMNLYHQQERFCLITLKAK